MTARTESTRPGALALAYLLNVAKAGADSRTATVAQSAYADLRALIARCEAAEARVNTFQKVAAMLEGARDEARADAERLAGALDECSRDAGDVPFWNAGGDGYEALAAHRDRENASGGERGK